MSVDEPALELSIEFSHGPRHPYLLRAYDRSNGGRTKVAYSDTFDEHDAAVAAAEALRSGQVRYRTVLASDGRYVWQALGTGSQVLATSLTGFSSLSRARAQLERVRANLASASVTDQTLRGERPSARAVSA